MGVSSTINGLIGPRPALVGSRSLSASTSGCFSGHVYDVRLVAFLLVSSKQVYSKCSEEKKYEHSSKGLSNLVVDGSMDTPEKGVGQPRGLCAVQATLWRYR